MRDYLLSFDSIFTYTVLVTCTATDVIESWFQTGYMGTTKIHELWGEVREGFDELFLFIYFTCLPLGQLS